MQVYYSQDIREEELKNKVSQDWFNSFDTTQIVGYIDFCVCANVGAIRPVPPFERDKKAVSPFERDNKVPPFEGVGGVSQDAGGAPPITGNESASLSKSRSTWDAGGSPAITGNESVSLSKTQSVLQDRNAVSQAASGLYADTMSMPPIVGNASERCKTDSQRLETLATTDGETPANPTTESKSASLSQTLLWGEAKAGIRHSLYHSLVQLILTIGKARTFDKHLPPLYLTAFDAAEIAFLPYHTIQSIFYQNDFNWNVRPSDHNSKEFLQLLELVEKTLKDNALVFNFAQDSKALKDFIRNNLKNPNAQTIQKVQINKNNFTFIYQRWCEEVKDSIQIDWDKVKKMGLIDADFYLADLLSQDNTSILDKLYVLLKSDHYQFARDIDEYGLFSSKTAQFRDKMQAHRVFWNKYERPPKREYWDYIVERRDLLVPQDVRERKGSFFTPKQWVELSQQYLAETLGENWQDEYTIWDCCAGTGNLLNGLTNKRNIWASTLDRADVDVMHERIKHGANLYDDHVFQFDFLNDELAPISGNIVSQATNDFNAGGTPTPRQTSGSKSVSLPQTTHFPPFEGDKGGVHWDTGGSPAERKTKWDPSNDKASVTLPAKKTGKIPNELYDILSDPDKRKKLIIYINPPYAEAGNRKTASGTGTPTTGVSVHQLTYKKFVKEIGLAGRELFAQFFIRIYKEIPGCTLAEFSKLKILQASNFAKFREIFQASLKNLFLVPAQTFDNVKGQFPIGFFIWDTSAKKVFEHIVAQIYNDYGENIGEKDICVDLNFKSINDWLITTRKRENEKKLAWMSCRGCDMQVQTYNFLTNDNSAIPHPRGSWITNKNLIECCVYLSVYQSIRHTWLNDRDQFLYPNDGWQTDRDFQFNCLVFSLFHNQNRITNNLNDLKNLKSLNTPFINHWIPFTEEEMGITVSLQSHFMSDYIRDFLAGKISIADRKQHEGYTNDNTLFNEPTSQLQAQGGNGKTHAGGTSRDVDISPTGGADGSSAQTTRVSPPSQTTWGAGGSPAKTQSVLTPSPQAQAVLDAGREVYRYYHQTWQQRGGGSPDASLYDIKEYFKGRNDNGKMNNKSDDPIFNELMERLRATMQDLAEVIEPKVYEYGFLK